MRPSQAWKMEGLTVLELNSRPSGMLSTRTMLNTGGQEGNEILPREKPAQELDRQHLCRCLLTCRGLSRLWVDGGCCSGMDGRKEPWGSGKCSWPYRSAVGWPE